eukprot:gene3632-4065_t
MPCDGASVEDTLGTIPYIDIDAVHSSCDGVPSGNSCTISCASCRVSDEKGQCTAGQWESPLPTCH